MFLRCDTRVSSAPDRASKLTSLQRVLADDFGRESLVDVDRIDRHVSSHTGVFN